MLFFPTVDEDVQYFRSQGYTGSINDMHFKAMGDLGYTGSLNDRIHAYLTFKYGSYYEAMRDLRNGTSVFALSSYIINGFDPALVFDFKENYYRKSTTASTFAASMTHTASSNATMVDSDGLLKWRPHNLLTNSSNPGPGNWSGALSVSAVTTGSPFGTYRTISPSNDSTTLSGAFQRFQIGKTISSGATYGGWALVKYSAGSGFFDLNMYDTGKSNELAWFDLQNGVVGTKDSLIVDHGMIDYGDGWWLCFATSIATSNSGGFSIEVPNGDGVVSCSAADEILIAGTQFYRSDLGGMVDNYTYIPTTTSPIYGPRVGHHIYNGTDWVNEGILHESEARTNIIENSNDLTAAGWSTIAASNSANVAVSPDGTSNADKVVPNTSFGRHYTFLTKNLEGVSGSHSFSVYVAAAGYGFATVCAGTDGAQNYYAVVIDLSNGTKTATYSSGVHTEKTCTVEAVGSYFKITVSGYGEKYYVVGAVDTGTYTPRAFGFKEFSADGTSGILVYGAQLETGLTGSSYIPTSGSAAIRSADLLTVPAANLPYDSTNMSIQMDGKMTYADGIVSSEVEMYRWLLSSSNYINSTVQAYATKTGEPVFSQRQASSGLDSVVGSGNTYAPGTDVPLNIAVRHGSTFINAAINGTALTANTTPTALPDLSGSDLTLGFDFMGTIGQFRMWDEDLTDAGIAEAST